MTSTSIVFISDVSINKQIIVLLNPVAIKHYSAGPIQAVHYNAANIFGIH